MAYLKRIEAVNPIKAWYNCGSDKGKSVILQVGNLYKVAYETPTTKKDRKNNGRIIQILGFTDSFFADVIVRYMDNNRIGRLKPNCLLPYTEE